MSESLREKAKRHPRLVNRLLAGGLILSLMVILAMAFLLQSQQYTTNQMATQMAVAQAALDDENAALRSQRLVSHARMLADNGQVNLALAFALEAVKMPNPPLETQRLLWDLMQMPAVEKLIVGDNENYLRDVGITGSEMMLYDSEERTFIALNLDTGEQKSTTKLDASIESDFYPLSTKWGVIYGPPCVLTDMATFKIRIPMETCLAEVRYDFSPDGRYFVLVESYGNTHLYDLETGSHRLLNEDSLLDSWVVFSPDSTGVYLTGRRNLYTSNDQPPVALYFPIDGEPQPVPSIEKNMLPMTGTYLARSDHGGLYVLTDYALRFWQQGYFSSDSLTLARHYSVNDFVSSPQGDTVILTEKHVGGGCCRRYDAHLMKMEWGMPLDFTVTRLNMLGGGVYFSEDGKRAVITGVSYPVDESDQRFADQYLSANNIAILAVEPAPPKPLAVIPGNYHILSFDEQDLMVTRSNQDGTSTLMRLASPGWQSAWEYTPDFGVLSASYGGQRVLLEGSAGEVQIINAVTGDLLHQWQTPLSQLRATAFNPQGTQVALLSYVPYSSPDPAKLYLYDAASGALQAEVEFPGDFGLYITYSPDGQLLWIDGYLYDSAGTLLREFSPEKAQFGSGELTTFLPEENAVLMVDGDGDFIKFDLATGEILEERSFNQSVSGGVIDMARQRIILETGRDRIVITTPETLYTLQSWEAGDVGAVRDSLIAATRDNALLLWHIETVEELAERVRTTRHIPEIECISDAIYRDIARCNP